MSWKRLQRDGATVAYSIRGDGDAVLLGHSLLLSGAMWERVEGELARGFRVLNVDARGHRHSTAAAPFTLEDLADDWLAVLDAEEIERAHLVGLSMGGMTAMRMAAQAPERVRKLALFGASAGSQPWPEAVKFGAMAEITRRFGYLEALLPTVVDLFTSAESRRREPGLEDWLTAHIRGNDPKQVYHGIMAVVRRTNVLSEISGLRCPTLVVVGAEDAAAPVSNARALADRIEGSRLEVLEGVGHLPPVEAPEMTNALLEWLKA